MSVPATAGVIAATKARARATARGAASAARSLEERREAPQPAKRRDAPPAPVTMLDEARGRRPAKPTAQPESHTEFHLPAFLLRPTLV